MANIFAEEQEDNLNGTIFQMLAENDGVLQIPLDRQFLSEEFSTQLAQITSIDMLEDDGFLRLAQTDADADDFVGDKQAEITLTNVRNVAYIGTLYVGSQK